MSADIPYNKWEDPAFVAEMEARVRSLEDGTDKGYSWEEVKQMGRDAVNAKRSN